MFLFKRGKFYHLEYFDQTENKMKRISTKYVNKKDALVFVNNFKADLKKIPKANLISIRDFQSEYLEYVKINFSKSYYVTVEVSFRLLIREIGNVPLDKISYNQAEKFLTVTFKRTKEGARTYLIALKSAFNKAIRWGYIKENIFTQLKLPKIPKHLPATISISELMKIIQNTDDIDLQDIYLTAFHTAMRLSEIINLRWESIELEERKIIIRNTEIFTTKSKKERIIPMNDTLYRVFINRAEKENKFLSDFYVFRKHDNVPYLKDYVSKNFKRTVRKLGMNELIHFHSLRHSFATELVSKGVSLYVVKELLGHSDFSTTQIYAHLQRDSLKEAIKILD